MALGRTNVGGSGSKVKLDGEKVTDKLELTSYNGDNPLTIGAEGVSFPANTLFVEDFNIVNGVNGEDLTDTVTDQTTAVEELMRMVSRKIAMNNGEGQYVWKKIAKATTNGTINIVQNTDTKPYIFQLTSADVNLDELNAYYFNGTVFTATDGSTLEFVNNTEAKFTASGGTYRNGVFSYNPTTHQITFEPNVVTATISIRTWNSLSVVAEDERIIGYVISSDTEAYPNGAIHTDGYFYELVGEGVNAEGFGYSKMDVVSFTPPNDTKVIGHTINHNLETTPKMVMVYASGALSKRYALATFTYNTEWVISGVTGDTTQYGALITSNPTGSSTSANATMKKMLTLNTNSISFTDQGNNSNWIFASGVKYVCAVFA